jgi:S1-C subfamily serine protease
MNTGGGGVRVPAGTNTAARDRQPVESFALERGVGTRVVAAGARLHTAGLLAGDVITRAGQVAAPTPAQVRQLLGRASDRGFAVLVVRRDGRQRVLAVPVPGEADAAR